MYFKIIANECKIDILSAIAYKFGFLSDIFVFGGLQTFLFLMNSGSSMQLVYNNHNALELLFIGYIVWVLSCACLSSIAGEINKEMMIGTFYHKINSGVPIYIIYIGKVIASFINSIVAIFVLSILAKIIFQVSISINLLIFIAIVVNMIAIYGLSLIIGSFAIYFKKTGSIIFVIQLFLLLGTGVMGFSGNAMPIYQKLIPVSFCIDIIRNIVSGNLVGVNIWIEYIFICLLYIFIGIFSIKISIVSAKKKGNLLIF